MAELVPPDEISYRLATQIHKGLGLGQHHALAGYHALCDLSLEKPACPLEVESMGNAIDAPETDVVAGLCVFPAGISQPNYKSVDH